MLQWLSKLFTKRIGDVQCCSCDRVIMATVWNKVGPRTYMCNSCKGNLGQGIITV